MRYFLLIAALAGLALAGAAPAAPAETKTPAERRIISLYAAHTEVLLRLGARDNLVGVSERETYEGPETAGWQPRIFTSRDDVEKFLAARPDLVLVRPMHLSSNRQLMAALKRSGIEVLARQVQKSGELYAYWRELGALVGRQAEAEDLIADFDRQVAAYRAAAARRPEAEKPGVFLEAIHTQVKTFTPDSLPAWLVELAGGRNVAADARAQGPGLIIADYGPERLLAKAGEVDVFISQAGPMNRAGLGQILGRPAYQPLAAFKTGRVHKIPEAVLARPTPALLTGLKELARATGLTLDE
ncbi:MAG: ABC transporter substrate-binding protein [Candidatus Adiutrix sp.]|jgi:iron complex transport system substrate-binding protein|nr:ABC transporter substrate-binding protein [Candidatus Adiutrix sp.]